MILFNSNAFILTANRRLAEAIRQDTAHQRQNQQQLVWETPKALPLITWLQTLWQMHPLGTEQLLTHAQEQQIWSQIIQDSRDTLYPLLHVDNTVQLVQQAWQLLNHWQLSLDMLDTENATAEVNLFVHWCKQFISRCQQQRWLSEASLPQWLQAALLRHPLPITEPLIIAGFDELPPAYQCLLEIFRQSTTVTEMEVSRTVGACQRQIFADLESEITQMAEWAKNQLATNSQQHIGCVIPQLTQHRATVVRIFKQIFPPAAQRFLNISAGQSLNEFAMIATALQVLQLDSENLAVATLGQWLQSPYLCQNETDIHFGAQVDAQCRRWGNFVIPLTVFFTAITDWQIHYPGQTWLQRWRALTAVNATSPPHQQPSAWANHFTHQLTALGWPGGRRLNESEYQLLARWQELLEELAALDVVAESMTQATALHSLQRLAAQAIFQPQTTADAPVQILGVLESSGFYFDALWVMGLDDQHWPPPAQPNPFLPYQLQIQRKMPHASAQRELVYAQKIMRRLLGSAKAIWLSCSASEPDKPARFSRLTPVDAADFPIQDTSPTTAAIIFAAARQESITDLQGPVVATTEKIRGGSGILTQQAQCPFRAFATFRLNATPLGKPELGVSALQHGILLHGVLERVWNTLKTQQNLLAMSTAALEKLLGQTIDDVIQEELTHPKSPFAQIEKTRLQAIIREWLVLEKQRPPFTVIEQETERAIELAGLRLRLKIDRIDQFGDGSQLLIDYKTGVTQIQAWLTQRLQQPQLPLYALDTAQQNHFSGVAFAQLHIGQLAFKGLHTESLSDNHYFPAGVISIAEYGRKDMAAPQTWQALLTHWRDVLQQLGVDFSSGYAAVDPADHGAPCQTCDLQALCRIHAPLNAPEPS